MRHTFTLILFLLTLNSFGQLNMEVEGHLDIPSVHLAELNDIWGYTDEAGNEYALVGVQNGVSIVDISNPSDPVEVEWIDGLLSVWRDIKTYGDYAYVTTEALQGLMIIDLSPLPASTDLPVTFYNGPEDGEWLSAHNLYQDNGYVYIFGAGRDNGGVIILDVATDPLNPIEVGVFDNWYAHDGYVQNDTGYFGHIYDGFFTVVDLTDKTSPVLLGSAMTPTSFAHNIWASEDGNYVFTTDEVSGGYIGSFDVSDPSSIVFLDRIQSTPGAGIVPHNSHVKGNFLYTSYYTDGVVIHDITYPDNMVEVGHYDTSPLSSPNTDGCWGVYPFFESGNIVASDRQEGLFVLSFNEQQGSYLQGEITEAGTGFPINGVTVSIEGEDNDDLSDVIGNYHTGTAAEGTLDVTYFKVLYFPQTIPVEFENGVIATQDVVLEKIPEFSVSVRVLDAETLEPIEGAQVQFEHTYIIHEGTTGADGWVDIPLYYQDNYQIHAGKWGHVTTCYSDSLITDETTELVFLLDKGIMDDFTLDFGWNASGSATRGHWEREIPVGVANSIGIVENPYSDVDGDCGNFAFLTGNGTSATNTEEVNGGEVLLLSPQFDLTTYSNPHVNYASWFFCRYGYLPLNDTMNVYLLNGLGDIALIDQHYYGRNPEGHWHGNSVPVADEITLTENMQLLFVLSDYPETENVTEGGVDNFSITDYSILAVEEEPRSTQITIFPNPFNSSVNIDGVENGWLEVFDVSGRKITEVAISNSLELSRLESGTYFFVISDENRNVLRVITQVKN